MRPKMPKIKWLGQRRCSDSFFAPWFTLEQSQQSLRRHSEKFEKFKIRLVLKMKFEKSKNQKSWFQGDFLGKFREFRCFSGIVSFGVDKLPNEYFGLYWQARGVVELCHLISFAAMHLDLVVRSPKLEFADFGRFVGVRTLRGWQLMSSLFCVRVQ